MQLVAVDSCKLHALSSAECRKFRVNISACIPEIRILHHTTAWDDMRTHARVAMHSESTKQRRTSALQHIQARGSSQIYSHKM